MLNNIILIAFCAYFYTNFSIGTEQIPFKRAIRASITNGAPVSGPNFFVRIIVGPQSDSPFYCGGAIVGQVWLVTAAQCVHNQTSKIPNYFPQVLNNRATLILALHSDLA